MRVIVCGSRTWTDRDAIWDRLDKLPRPVTIVHGACRSGADAFAQGWVDVFRFRTVRHGISVEQHPAIWKNGRAAGPIRNSHMASLGADLCIAFHDGKSRGTADMIRKARAAGIPTEIITS